MKILQLLYNDGEYVINRMKFFFRFLKNMMRRKKRRELKKISLSLSVLDNLGWGPELKMSWILAKFLYSLKNDQFFSASIFKYHLRKLVLGFLSSNLLLSSAKKIRNKLICDVILNWFSIVASHLYNDRAQ